MLAEFAIQKKDSVFLKHVLNVTADLKIMLNDQSCSPFFEILYRISNSLINKKREEISESALQVYQQAYDIMSFEFFQSKDEESRIIRMLLLEPESEIPPKLDALLKGSSKVENIPLATECIRLLTESTYHKSKQKLNNIPQLFQYLHSKDPQNELARWVLETLIHLDSSSNNIAHYLIFLSLWPGFKTKEEFCQFMTKFPKPELSRKVTVWLYSIVHVDHLQVQERIFALIPAFGLENDPNTRQSLIYFLTIAWDEIIKTENAVNCCLDTIAHFPAQHGKKGIYSLLNEYLAKLTHADFQDFFNLLNIGCNRLNDPIFVNQCLRVIEEFDVSLLMPISLDLRKTLGRDPKIYHHPAGFISKEVIEEQKPNPYYIPAAVVFARAPLIADQFQSNDQYLAEPISEHALEAVLTYICCPQEPLKVNIDELINIYTLGKKWGVIGLQAACYRFLTNCDPKPANFHLILLEFFKTAQGELKEQIKVLLLKEFIERKDQGKDSKIIASSMLEYDPFCMDHFRWSTCQESLITKQLIEHVKRHFPDILTYDFCGCYIDPQMLALVRLYYPKAHALTLDCLIYSSEVDLRFDNYPDLTLKNPSMYAMTHTTSIKLNRLSLEQTENDTVFSLTQILEQFFNQSISFAEWTKTLKSLKISYPESSRRRFTTTTAQLIFSRLATLTELTLENPGRFNLDLISKYLPNLTSLSISGDFEETLNCSEVADLLNRYPKLERLTLIATRGELDSSLVAAIMNKPIQALCIQGNLNDELVSKMIATLPDLEHLDLSHNSIDTLCGIEKLSFLRSLTLVDTNLSGPRILSLGSMEMLKNIIFKIKPGYSEGMNAKNS